MIDIYGTIGPACANPGILKQMFTAGMTGMRLNTSHVSVKEAADQIEMIQEAAKACGKKAKILIDMQGPELRIGKLKEKLLLEPDSRVFLTAAESDSLTHADCTDQKAVPRIPVPSMVLDAMENGMEVLLDDGKILLEILETKVKKEVIAYVKRGGLLSGGKSIALPNSSIRPPAMTAQDKENLKDAVKYGITGVMQPFVRDEKDLKEVKTALVSAGGHKISLLAKIENLSGVENMESFFGIADEIVIARGDLGNAMPLWELPRIQKEIEKRCLAAGVPFMVVTQMLASMEHSAVPTRAEVSDIYNAVCDGASSVMVTGETAVGEYPIEVIRYLSNTVKSYEESLHNENS